MQKLPTYLQQGFDTKLKHISNQIILSQEMEPRKILQKQILLEALKKVLALQLPLLAPGAMYMKV